MANYTRVPDAVSAVLYEPGLEDGTTPEEDMSPALVLEELHAIEFPLGNDPPTYVYPYITNDGGATKMYIYLGDYLMHDVLSNMYPVRGDLFEVLYEEVP